MSSDFEKVLVVDDVLQCTDKLAYAVEKGAQQRTTSVFNAISASSSSIVWNIQVPSEQTVISREVMFRSTVTLQLSITAPAGEMPLQYGLKDALAPFPLHALMSVQNATINNNTVSLQTRDLLPSLLRFNDRRELQRFNGCTPTAFDAIGKYADGLGSNLNPLGAWSNSSDNDLFSRGSWVLDAVSTTAPGANGVITTITPPVVSTGAAQTVYVQFTCSEPLLMSPFIFAHPRSNRQGMYGVQNMSFTFNVGDCSRVWRSASSTSAAGTDPAAGKYITAASVVAFIQPQMIFQFLTPHPSQMLPARNVVGYMEQPRYLTSLQSAIAPANAAPSQAGTTTVQTSSIQLNQIPDKLLICVRKPMSSQTYTDSDSCLCIKGVSIQFNNQAGILSTATQQDLYHMSVEAGSNQNWFEFSGAANLADQASGVGRRVATTGSFLMLDFGRHINLSEEFYAPGSLGNFNLQVQLQIYNQFDYSITPEIMLVTINSGLFVLERGTASVYTAILTKSDVIDASSMEPVYKSSVERMVGGGWLDTLKSVIGYVLPHAARFGKQQLAQMDSPYAKAGAQVLGALGYGRSGGGAAGGSKLSERLMK